MRLAAPQWLSHDIADIVLEIRRWAQTCVTALSVEMRVQCVFHMSAMRSAAYVLEDAPSEPDLFVMEICRDLSRAQEAIGHVLSQSKMRYDTCAGLACSCFQVCV